MKVAVQILSTYCEPSTHNIQSMKDTFISLCNKLQNENKLLHTYDFYFYYAAYDNTSSEDITFLRPDNDVEHCYEIQTGQEENIYNTFEKGIYTLNELCNEHVNYDWYIRINISTYLNIPLIDRCLSALDSDIMYCNAINTIISDTTYLNDIYPRGDFMLFSNKMAKNILSSSVKYIRCDEAKRNRLDIPHVDDCLFGLCILDSYGNSYYDHIQQLTYNFIPNIDTLNDYVTIYAFASRVKTIPPNVSYSGYSWDDNDYRRSDCVKMKLLNDLIEKNLDLLLSISNTTALKYLMPGDILNNNNRTSIVVQYKNASIDEIKNILKYKRNS